MPIGVMIADSDRSPHATSIVICYEYASERHT